MSAWDRRWTLDVGRRASHVTHRVQSHPDPDPDPDPDPEHPSAHCPLPTAGRPSCTLRPRNRTDPRPPPAGRSQTSDTCRGPLVRLVRPSYAAGAHSREFATCPASNAVALPPPDPDLHLQLCALARPFLDPSASFARFMAPARSTATAPAPPSSGDTSAPLAEYFFIAGIESSQVYDEKANAAPPAAPVEDTIDEDRELQIDRLSNRPTTPGSPTEAVPRRSRYSFEARKSVGSIINAVEEKVPASNRSSTTIKAVQIGASDWSDDAFAEALKKFASERDSFIEENHISAGTVSTHNPQKRARPRTVRITQDEGSLTPNGNGLKGGVGSLRRRLSTMNSMKRASSVVSRSSVRQSKRLSGYNSVIPVPQPFSTLR